MTVQILEVDDEREEGRGSRNRRRESGRESGGEGKE